MLEDPTISFFEDGTAPHVAAVAQRTVDARLGNDEASWQWGRIHRAHWYHPLGDVAFGVGPREVDGGSHTLRNTGAELQPHAASSGAEYRIVVDFAAPDSFLVVQNIGNSGAARIIRISSNPGCAASTTRCICAATASKPIAKATIIQPGQAITCEHGAPHRHGQPTRCVEAPAARRTLDSCH